MPMKDNMFDVLMYIFENYIDDDRGDEPDEAALSTELGDAGFHQGEINKAFAWLEDLSQLCEQEYDDSQSIACSSSSNRIYSDQEKHKISLDARGFITRLEFYRIINTSVREVILDRAMALEAEHIDLDQMKWVAMMVLYNQPGRETNYLWLENLLFELEQEVLH
jgi:Smg protein